MSAGLTYIAPGAFRRRQKYVEKLMSYSRRRRVFVETPSGLRSAGFTVPAVASAVDVSLELRKRGFAPYRLRFEAEQEAWIAALMDWRSAA